MEEDRDALRLALERRLDDLANEERELRASLKLLRERLAHVRMRGDRTREQYEAEFGVEPSQRRRDEADRFAGVPWAPAIRAVLREEERPLHRDELWRALEAGGFYSESNDPKRTLVAILGRLPDVARVGRGVYELREEASAW